MVGQLGAELCRESVSPVVGGARNEGKAERCVVLPLVTPGSQQVRGCFCRSEDGGGVFAFCCARVSWMLPWWIWRKKVCRFATAF